MKKLVMLFLATMVLAGASFAQATTSTDNGMKSDAKTEAPKKAKKAKKDKAAATTDAAPATK
jgi:Ni/Co efflux regulator RcnB